MNFVSLTNGEALAHWQDVMYEAIKLPPVN